MNQSALLLEAMQAYAAAAERQPDGTLTEQARADLHRIAALAEGTRVEGESEEFAEKRDRRGHRYCIDDHGKRIKCSDRGGQASTTGTQAQKKARRSGRPAPAPRHGLLRHLAVGAVRSALATGHFARASWAKLGPRQQQALTTVARAGRMLYHKMEAPRHHFEALAKEVARERGLGEEHVKTVGHIMAAANIVEQWAVNIPVAHHALHEAGLGGLAGLAVSKVGALIPVTALAYLGYSTAASTLERNPLALYRAAHTLIKGASVHSEYAEGDMDERDLAGRLLEALQGAADPDWYVALLMAALEDGTPLAEAIDRADRAAELQPEPPGGQDEPG